jgi:hypothetical protein
LLLANNSRADLIASRPSRQKTGWNDQRPADYDRGLWCNAPFLLQLSQPALQASLQFVSLAACIV